MASWTSTWTAPALLLLLLALLDLTASASVSKTKCPVVPGKSPFDVNKFRGDWLLIAGSPDSLAARGKCGKYSASAGPGQDGLSLRFAGQAASGSGKSSSPLAVDVLSQAVAGDKVALSHAVFRKQGDSDYEGVFKQSIVATDYDNYAVVVSCRQTYVASTKSFGRNLFAEIWARKTNLSPETISVLKNVLSSYDLDVNDIKNLDRSKC